MRAAETTEGHRILDALVTGSIRTAEFAESDEAKRLLAEPREYIEAVVNPRYR